MSTIVFFTGALWFGDVPAASAQTPPFRYELLSLLPDDFAVCAVMHDLRGQAQRWENSAWFKTFRASPLGKEFFDAPELKALKRWEKDELKKHFDLDFAALRDDILGDTVILSYSSGASGKPEDERGLFLIHARKPQRLKRFIDQLNELQQKRGELKKLTALEHKGKTYYRREQGKKTQFYAFEDSLLAASSREELIQHVLGKKANAAKTVWADRFRKAGADKAFVTLCVNPRAVAPDFIKQSKKEDGLPGYWQALEGIFLSLAIRDDAELRLSIQANAEQLPAWTRSVFTKPPASSKLWQYFPQASIATLAARTDFAAAAEAVTKLMPEKERNHLIVHLQRTVGAFLHQDVFKEVLPNIGPDWGLCVLPAATADQLPQLLIAVAVQPGSKEPLDRSLFKGVEMLAHLAVLGHNSKDRPDKLRLQTIMQNKIKVLTVSGSKFFPPGVQPACALKEGFLLFASSPDAILQFHHRQKEMMPGQGTPLFALSTQELAKLLRQRQSAIVNSLRQRPQMTPEQAQKNVAGVIALLEMCDRVTLSQDGGAGQASWSLRLTPKTEKSQGDGK